MSAALRDDLLESVQVSFPGAQLRAQLLQVKIVFQRFLEIVGGHQAKQVVCLGRVRKVAQLDDPVGILLHFFPHQGLEKMTFADALDGDPELVDFGAELLQRAAIRQCRLAGHIQLAVGKGDGEHGFLHRGVRDLSRHDGAPGHQRPFEATLKGVRPSRAQQRPIGEWTGQTHPVEHLLGALEIFFL